MLWGVYFGLILIIEKIFMLKVLEKLPKIFRHIYTMLLVLISWVIFAFEDLGQIGTYLSTMFGLNGASLANPEAIYYLKSYIVIIIIGIIFSIPIFKHKKTEEIQNEKMNKAKKNSITKKQIIISVLKTMCFVAILILCTASLVNNSFNPFLYFRF